MVLKMIFFLFGRLNNEQKKEVLKVLETLIKAGAEGAVAGSLKK